ncbi:MAG: hypothetical protein WBE92_15675 [Steroidobacteraceae bacterium]
MDKTIRRYDTIEAMHAASVRAWQRIPGRDELRAVTEITQELYALKGQAPYRSTRGPRAAKDL